MILLYLTLALQAPSDSLTLEQALQRARTERGAVAAAAAGVAEARAGLRTAGAIPNPTVSYSHSEATPRNHFLVDQSLDWLLRRGPERDAARSGIARAEADSALTVSGLVRDVRVAFYRARASRLAEALAGSQAELADSVAHIAAARLRAGDISLLEQEQAAQEAARARQAASVAREAAQVDEAELARAIAWERAGPHPAGPLDAGLDRLPDTTIDLATLPALRSAIADSAAAAARSRSASLGRVPLPTVQSGAEWGDQSQPGALAVVGVSVPLPLWNRGGGAVGEARAVAIDSQGRIVVAGTSGSDFALARFNSDGSLDNTFDGPTGTNGDGKFKIDIGSSSSDAAYGLAIQSDGKIVVVGKSGNDFAIVRLTDTGALRH
jgi:uncharacterized delta-60 repeat protein